MDKMNLNSIPSLIQWHEGMLIGPQHFQQAIFRQEGLLSYHLQNVIPYYWGIQEIEIDKGLLVSGIFQIGKLQAVMPDGLAINFVSNDTSKLELDLNDYKDQIKEKDLTIQLAVPVQKIDQATNKSGLARYNSIKGDLTSDYNSGDNSILIPRLIPAISLMVADELSAKYTGFPVAKVSFKDANFIITDYVPPGLDIASVPKIESLGKKVVQQLREKANFLSEKIQATSSATGLSTILETKETIRSVVNALPYLETVLRSSRLHPFALYQAMAQVVGNLAFLDRGFIPPILEPYDHNNLLGVFTTVYDYIVRITEQGIQEKYTVFSFRYNSDEHSFKIDLKEDWITPNMIIGVRGQPGMNLPDVKEWLDKCVIGSESKLPSMRERRISGVPRKTIEGNENLIPLRGVQLFTLSVDKDYVTPGEKLCIINPANQVPGTLRADEIVLYIDNENITPDSDLENGAGSDQQEDQGWTEESATEDSD